MTPKLDRLVQFDERSREFPMAEPVPPGGAEEGDGGEEQEQGGEDAKDEAHGTLFRWLGMHASPSSCSRRSRSSKEMKAALLALGLAAWCVSESVE